MTYTWYWHKYLSTSLVEYSLEWPTNISLSLPVHISPELKTAVSCRWQAQCHQRTGSCHRTLPRWSRKLLAQHLHDSNMTCVSSQPLHCPMAPPLHGDQSLKNGHVSRLLMAHQHNYTYTSAIHVGSHWKMQDRRRIKNKENAEIKYNSEKQTMQNHRVSVASYDTRPGNEVSLFYNAPEHTRGKWATNVFINTNKKYLDCDQSNYSSRIILSHIPAKCIHLKFSKKTWGRLLDLVQPEVDPYNTPTPETTLLPTCKHVDSALFAILKLSQLEAAILFPASKLYSPRCGCWLPSHTKSSSNVLRINSDVMWCCLRRQVNWPYM